MILGNLIKKVYRVINHEYLERQDLHPRGTVFNQNTITEDEEIREVNAHGVSIVHLHKILKLKQLQLISHT